MNYVNLLKSKRKLFSYSVNYNGFKNITQEKIAETKEKVRKKYEGEKCIPEAVFQYLSGPKIQAEIADYDEKILFLIMALDPDFLMHKIYLDSKIILESTINRASGEEKEALIKERRQQLNTFINRVKTKFGFYDKNFLTYESDLRKILEKDKLLFNIKYDALSKMLERIERVKNFDNLTDEDFKRLKTFGDRWLREAPNPSDYNSLAYNLLTKPELFSIKNVQEQVALFILLFDPEFKMRKIYEGEPNEDLARDKCEEGFGFYDYSLLTCENNLRGILEKDKLLFNIKFYDAFSKMLEITETVKNFDNLTDEDFKRLKTFGDRWFVEAPNPNDYNSLAYNLLTKPELFSIKTISEQVLQFILLVDPELKMLKIYEEETREEFIKARCEEEFGFYDQHLIQLEKKYHDKFLPDKKVSVWRY